MNWKDLDWYPLLRELLCMITLILLLICVYIGTYFLIGN